MQDENLNNALTLPLSSLSKKQITEHLQNWLNGAVEHYPPQEVFIFLKQAEYLVEEAIKGLKPLAAQSFGSAFQGAKEGEVLGHSVTLASSSEYIYPASVTELKEKQEKELKAARLQAQANGTATKIDKGVTIRVTLREK